MSFQSPIAIVGIAAELPSGSWSSENLDYNSFFKFLLASGEAYEKIPPERFNVHTLKGDGIGQVHTDTGTFLKDVHLFDHVEFGITSKDARLMGLSTRKLIELSFLGLLDSGINYRGQNVGCYMSGVAHDMFSVSGHDDGEARGSFAYGPAMVANRVSYHLDLRGPSIPLDTACSSSLHATHLAVQALCNGECEAAIIGGCQINHRFSEWLLYTQGGVLSRDGKCKPFDASADGFGRGEGAVVMVLKPLEKAIEDNDHIYATILGTGVNSSGSLAPVNAPVASAQQDAMLRAFSSAKRTPQDVDYIELHATGTAQGDPTEANWVGDQFKREDELIIGSVKGNIGHLEITSFLASLCKVCSILQSGVIPPNVNLKERNPAINWEEYKFQVPLETIPLPCRGNSGLPLIAMTSSGIGGANGHCVVEGPQNYFRETPSFWTPGRDAPALLIAGGLSPRSTTAGGELLASKNSSFGGELQTASRMLGRRVRSMTWRSFAVSSAGEMTPFSEPVLVPKTTPPLVFVFSGQGTQYYDMGRELFNTCLVFRLSVLEMDAVYHSITGESLIVSTGLFGSTTRATKLDGTWPIATTLPALTIIQIALVDTLALLGVTPDIVVGHSAGETAVLHASGAASKAVAVELAIARGKAMSTLEGSGGAMAALSCSPEDASTIIMDVITDLGPAALEVGCHNAPNAVTLSGATSHVELAVAKAQAAGIFARRLRTAVPVHSSMMDLCRTSYEELVGSVFDRHTVTQPQTPTYSTKSGQAYTGNFDKTYFWESTRGPVLFTEAIQAVLVEHANPVFLEIGPHPVLTSYLVSLTSGTTLTIPVMTRPKPNIPSTESVGLMVALGQLVVAGIDGVNFDALCGVSPGTVNVLPQFPFARKEVPYKAPTLEVTRQHQHRHGPLNYPQLQVNSRTHPGLAEHIIKGEPIMPAAGYVEMALEYGARKLWDVDFLSILSLSSERPVPVQVSVEDGQWSVRSAFSSDEVRWPVQYNRLHAKGFLSTTADPLDEPPALQLQQIQSRLSAIDTRGIYEGFAHFATYGPSYQRIVACHVGADALGRKEILVQVTGIDVDLPDAEIYCLHPAILDSALHILVHPEIVGSKDKEVYYLPSRIGTFIVHDALVQVPSTIFTHAIAKRWTPDTLVYDLTVVDGDGTPLCSLEDVEVTKHGDRGTAKLDKRYELVSSPVSISVASCRAKVDHEENTRAILEGIVHEDGDGQNFNLTTDSSETVTLHPHTIIAFTRGSEMELQKQVSELDPLSELSICFTASEGPNGDALLGFSRSFRREYRVWTVRSIVFDPAWTDEERLRVATVLCTGPADEHELSVDAAGNVSAPRIVLSTSPRLSMPFQPGKPWIFANSQLKHISSPSKRDGFVHVHVTGVAEFTGQLWAFVGSTEGIVGRVWGITSGTLSNLVVAHEGSLIQLPSVESGAVHGPSVLAGAIGVLAVGIHSFSHPERLRHAPILVTHSDGHIGERLVHLYASLGLQVVAIPSAASFASIRSALSGRPGVVVSGYDEASYIRYLKEAIPSTTKLFLWSDPEIGLPALLRTDPWLVGDALRTVIEVQDIYPEKFKTPEEMLPQILQQVDTLDLFDGDSVYLLIGGIGSLGVKIALWMCQRGAREIVLTSRSGRNGLARRGDNASRQLLAYLEALPGIVIRAEAVDALSLEDMSNLMARLEKPLGGCMILTAVLVDRSFTAQTATTFEQPHAAKVGVFQVLERVTSINSLPFLISFSSVSGMFGNAGQTNYASANTALSGLTRQYRNAMSLVCPAIIDTGLIMGRAADTVYSARLRHVANWGMTCRELCNCIEDGIRKLREGPISTYIPAVDWNLVQSNMGPSSMYGHLIRDEDLASESLTEDHPATVSGIVSQVLDITSDDLSLDVPFTAYGLDSLSAASLSYALRPLLSVSQLQLLADLTLRQLQSLHAEASVPTIAGPDAVTSNSRVEGKAHRMVDMLDKYSVNFTRAGTTLEDQTNSPPAPTTVLITGVTGSLGSHVLARLLRSSSVDTVYAFSRQVPGAMDPVERLNSAFVARGLDISLLEQGNLVILEGHLHEMNLGLTDETISKLRRDVTHIAHLAWNVDFGTPLPNFEPAIQGLRRLVDLALSSYQRLPPRLLFASTAGVFREPISPSPTAELPLLDPNVAIGSGYSESKWVAENLLLLASEHTDFRPIIVRIGQLTGGLNGSWKTSEWVPAMISASVALKCLPDGPDTISWLPVDVAAAAVIDMMDSPRTILHLRHPKPVPWTQMISTVSSYLSLPLVSYAEWLSRLENKLFSQDGASTESLHPAHRLVDFFRASRGPTFPRRALLESNGLMWTMAIDESLQVCPTLRDAAMSPLQETEIGKWLQYWALVGYIRSD